MNPRPAGDRTGDRISTELETTFTIAFVDDARTLTLPVGASLAEHLSTLTSPILFGCRTGICGTCAVLVRATARGTLAAATPEELEVLESIGETTPAARLACQLRLSADLTLESR